MAITTKQKTDLDNMNKAAKLGLLGTNLQTAQSNIGTLSGLSTTAKTNLVAAVNEIFSLGASLTPADGVVTNAKLATDVKVGSLAALTTTAKSTVVGAINELKASNVMGTHTVIADEQTAGKAIINTGKTINGFIVQVYRSGILMSSIKASAATTNLTVETNGSTYVCSTGDVINYIVF